MLTLPPEIMTLLMPFTQAFSARVWDWAQVLLGLFSLVTLLAHHLTQGISLPVRATAWYVKTKPTFSDAIALVRYHLWTNMKFVKSPAESRFPVISDSIFDGLMETICYAT